MRLTASEEYGMRCMLQVARRAPGPGSVPLPIRIIADGEGLSVEYAAKLLRGLRQAGLIASVRGASGGYVLARPAHSITAGEVLAVLDGPLYSASFCGGHTGQRSTCVHTPSCSVRVLWRVMGDALDEVLARVTLADLLRGEEPLAIELEAAASGRSA